MTTELQLWCQLMSSIAGNGAWAKMMQNFITEQGGQHENGGNGPANSKREHQWCDIHLMTLPLWSPLKMSRGRPHPRPHHNNPIEALKIIALYNVEWTLGGNGDRAKVSQPLQDSIMSVVLMYGLWRSIQYWYILHMNQSLLFINSFTFQEPDNTQLLWW